MEYHRHYYFFDEDGNPMEMRRWISRMHHFGTESIGRTEVGEHVVSTVWTGVGCSCEGPPKIYETAVLVAASVDHEAKEMTDVPHKEHVATRKEALEVHARVVAALRAGTLTFHDDETVVEW